MVPCQSRQLVILSLPFAALVAFFWFKRRRSQSRSDPGGTTARQRPADTAANGKLKIEAKSVAAATPAEAEVIAKTVPRKEPAPQHSGKEVAKVVKPVEITPAIEKKIVCNGAAAHVKEVENHPSTPDFEGSRIFHSTFIEGDKDLEEIREVYLLQGNQSVKEDIFTKEEEDKNCQESGTTELHSGAEKSDTEEKEASEPTNSDTLANQCTLKHISLKKTIEEKELDKTLNLDNNCASCSDTLERVENVSVDTGLGSQDPSAVEECSVSMAQGQRTDEKSENTAGLEQKLASLGLDTTQQPAQRSERDSANHSPAEVMLNSPAISTFSDVHSEVVNWLNRCEPTLCNQLPKVDTFDSGLHVFVPFQLQPFPSPLVLWCPVYPYWGSSDSGKGCSDVVTPPSRTPAGGSSVAGDLAPSVYEFVLPQVIVGRLIGRHGAFLQDIRAKTHTNVFIKKHPETNSLKICAIEGTQQDIDAALKMIRQKFPLRRFPDLTLEKVSFVKNTCLPINPENLQLHLVEGVNNDVILSSLITAGNFFLQMPMHISYQSLYKLACIMNSVYNTQESPPLVDPQPNVVCVAPAHGNWYRAQIMSVDEESNTSEVKFLDYGGYMAVDNSCLRQIRGDFLLLPFQAVECVLANVVPAGGEEAWSEEARQFVQLMTTNQTLQAQVYDYTETGLPLVYLYCTQFYQSLTDPSGYETKVVLLNQELVSHGFADLIDSSEEDQPAAAESS